MKRLIDTGRALVLPADISIPDAYILGYNESKEEYIEKFLKDIKYGYNELLLHYNYSPETIFIELIEKWKKRKKRKRIMSDDIVYFSEIEEIKNTVCENINEDPTFWTVYVLQNGDTLSSVLTDIANDIIIMYHIHDNIKESIENGYKMIALGVDVVFLEEHIKII